MVQDWSSIPRNIQLHSSTPSFRYVTSRSNVYNSKTPGCVQLRNTSFTYSDATTPSPSIDTSGIGMPPVGKCKEVEEHCLMMPHGLCNGSSAGNKRITNWAICHECHSWYHCSCIGVSGKWFQSFPDYAFSCCKPVTDNRL